MKILVMLGNSGSWGVVNLRGRIGFRGYKQTDLVDKGQGAISFSPADIDEFGNVLNVIINIFLGLNMMNHQKYK